MMYEDYLSDEQLLELIENAESDEQIYAPEEMLNDILLRLELVEEDKNNDTLENYDNKPITDLSKPPREKIKHDSHKQYRLFCLKMAVSVAAAIAVVIAVPFFRGFDKRRVPVKPETVIEFISKTDYLEAKENSIIDNIGNLEIVRKTLDFTFNN